MFLNSSFGPHVGKVRIGHVGHAYVVSGDTIVSSIISLCFAMYHMDVIDVILWRMTPVNQCHFYECVEPLLLCWHGVICL